MLWWGFWTGPDLGEPVMLSQGGGSALVPHAALLQRELPGRLECLGPLGMWLNPGRSQLFFCCHFCPE